MAGFREFQTGEVLTAANVNDFLAKQAVMKFADASARDTALGTAVGGSNALREGMVAWLDSSDELQAYDGTSWSSVGGLALGTATPTDGQILAYGTATSTWNPTDGGALVAVKQATQGGAVSLSVSAGSSADITGLSITHTVADASNKVLLLAYIGQMHASTAYAAQLAGFAVDGTLVGIADSAGNRIRAGVGGRNHYNTIDYPWTSPPLMYVYTPGDTSSHTYTLRGINGLSSGTQTLYINRNASDSDTATNPRTLSSIILAEVRV